MKYDQERDAYLQHKGIKVIRFENQIVFENTEVVLREIADNFGRLRSGYSPLARGRAEYVLS